MHPTLADFRRRFPAVQWTVSGSGWSLRDTDQDASRVPLVLLPGAGGTGDTFYRAVDGLRHRRRVVSVTYPAVDDVNDLARGVLAALSHAGIGTFDVLGSSLGGYLAQLCALQEPTRVRRCMLANTFVDASWLQQLISRESLLSTSAQAHLAKTLAQLRSASEETPEQADFKRTMLDLVGTEQTAEAAKSALLAVLGAKPLPKLALPAGRVAILDAEDDPVVSAATREAIRQRYSDSPQFRLTTGGHYPALLNPQGFLAAVTQYFAEE